MSNTPARNPEVNPAKRILGSPHKILQEMINHKISGRLVIYDPQDLSVAWQLYLGDNCLHYATSAIEQKERLSCLLQQYRPDLPRLELQKGNEYDSLCIWWSSNKLPLTELQQLLVHLTQEALVHILTLTSAPIQYSKKSQLINPMLISVPLPNLLLTLQRAVYQWQRLRPYFSSPFTRLYLAPPHLDQFFEFWEQSQDNPTVGEFLNSQQLPFWIRTLNQKVSLYQAASLLGTKPILLATWLLPLLKAGVITTLPFSELESQIRPVVVCIDDSKTVQRQVQMTLEIAGYQVVSITEPDRAITTLVHHKPAVILMDINMPKIDGYELCRRFRQAKHLQNVPIVMLTGRDGFLDRLRAKLAGVTSYLTKPFEPAQLLHEIQQLAQPVLSKSQVKS